MSGWDWNVGGYELFLHIEYRVPELAEVESTVQIHGAWSGVDVDGFYHSSSSEERFQSHPLILLYNISVCSFSLFCGQSADEGFWAEMFCFNINFHAMSMLE